MELNVFFPCTKGVEFDLLAVGASTRFDYDSEFHCVGANTIQYHPLIRGKHHWVNMLVVEL